MCSMINIGLLAIVKMILFVDITSQTTVSIKYHNKHQI